MRSFKHWTPRYIFDRLNLMVDERSYSMGRGGANSPWLVRAMVEILENWLKPGDRGLEWGSGRSTTWFAERVEYLISVEHDAAWHGRVSEQLRQKGVRNVEYHLCEAERDYLSISDGLARESFDFCLVDGEEVRDRCALAALSLVKPGGIIIVDNCNRYLPSRTRSPFSRRPEQGPSTPEWTSYYSQVQEWRRIWTTNGVTDTCLWVKPGRVRESHDVANNFKGSSPLVSSV
jgi:predicted O-methyltransferase YrrM